MSAPIKVDVDSVFLIPGCFVIYTLALIDDVLLGNGSVWWLIFRLWLFLLVLDINWRWLLSLYTRIQNRVNELDEQIATANGCSCFFENYRWKSQIELMDSISNFTCVPITKFHDAVTDKLWLLSGIIGVPESFNEQKHGLRRFLRPVLFVEVCF